jgi:hypothetical protein
MLESPNNTTISSSARKLMVVIIIIVEIHNINMNCEFKGAQSDGNS